MPSSEKRTSSLMSGLTTKSLSTNSEHDPDEYILLLHSTGNRKLLIADLAAVSKLIKKQQETKTLPSSIDLKHCEKNTVDMLIKFVRRKRLKGSLSFSTLCDLLPVASSLEIGRLHRGLEEALVLSAEKSSEHLLQSILVFANGTVSDKIELGIYYLAAWNFMELTNSPTFQCIPFHQFVALLGSCELNVEHEMVVLDAALFWLIGQPNPTLIAPAVLATIRTGRLSDVEKQMFVERMRVHALPESICRLTVSLFNGRQNRRVCLQPEHIERHLPRCGNADQKRPTDVSLPLSRPRPCITWSERISASTPKSDAEKSAKSKKTASSRSKRRSRGKGTTSKSRSSTNAKTTAKKNRRQKTSRARKEHRRKKTDTKKRKSKKRASSRDSDSSSIVGRII